MAKVTTPTVPVLDMPVLADKALDALGTRLKNRLSWLANSYGRVERRPTKTDNGVIYEPMVFVGRAGNQDDYICLFPNQDLENHVFFYVADGEDLDWQLTGFNRVSVEFSAVFWFDFRKVYPDNHMTRTIENVKQDIYTALSMIKVPSFQFNKAWTEGKNIYKEFDYERARIGQNFETETDFLLRPFGGLRLDGVIDFRIECNDSLIQLTN